jgi:hypothetical protein
LGVDYTISEILVWHGEGKERARAVSKKTQSDNRLRFFDGNADDSLRSSVAFAAFGLENVKTTMICMEVACCNEPGEGL